MSGIEDMLGKRVLIKYPGDSSLSEETGILREIYKDGFLIEDKYGRSIFTPRNNAKVILLLAKDGGELNG